MPRRQTHVQTEAMRRKFAALALVAKVSRQDAVDELGDVFVQAVVELTPKDTNRLIRGWVQAGQEAGVSTMPMPPLQRSIRHEHFIRTIEKEIKQTERQIAKFKYWMEKYELEDLSNPFKKNGRRRKRRTSQKYYRKIKRLRAKFEKRREKQYFILEQAKSTESFLFFDKSAYAQRKRRSQFSTIRTTVYGGSGSRRDTETETVATLINHEPHGQLVERNWNLGHPVATAKALVKPIGLRRARESYLRRVRDIGRGAA